VSISYNLAVTIFSGFAPAVLTWLGGRGGIYAPGWYVTLAAILAAPALFSLKPSLAAPAGAAEPSPAGA
jgi:MHS family proline/betaine transporter-like MFS transporter